MTDQLRTGLGTIPDHYSGLLEAKVSGHALWRPEDCRERGGELGDCGYIMEGRFWRLFNIFRDPPDGIERLPSPTTGDVVSTVVPNSSAFLSSRSSTVAFQASLPFTVPPANVSVAGRIASKDSGVAFLACSGAFRVEEALSRPTAKRVARHLCQYYSALQKLGEGEVFIVRSVVKASGWVGGVAIRSERDIALDASFFIPGLPDVSISASQRVMGGNVRESNIGLTDASPRGTQRAMDENVSAGSVDYDKTVGPFAWSREAPAVYPVVLGSIRLRRNLKAVFRSFGIRYKASDTAQSTQEHEETSTGRSLLPDKLPASYSGSFEAQLLHENLHQPSTITGDEASISDSPASLLDQILDIFLDSNDHITVAVGDTALLSDFVAKYKIPPVPDALKCDWEEEQEAKERVAYLTEIRPLSLPFEGQKSGSPAFDTHMDTTSSPAKKVLSDTMDEGADLLNTPPSAQSNANIADMDAVPNKEYNIHVEVWSWAPWLPGSKSARASNLGSKFDSNAIGKTALEMSYTADDDSHKLEEHSSASLKVADRCCWRPAKCRFIEKGDHATLSIIFEDSVAYSIQIHTMRTTEVRLADRSLFNRSDCLGIHCKPGNGSATSACPWPLYMAFPSTDAVQAWVALLRSYTVPEVYGGSVGTGQGGLYRMWRQVEIQIVQGRNLEKPRKLNTPSSPTTYSGDFRQQDGRRNETDLFCEIVLDNHPVGRTSLKSAGGEPFWHESFTFGDLPPLGSLCVNILRAHHSLTTTVGLDASQPPNSDPGAMPATSIGVILGHVETALATLRRGEWVEGWFPVHRNGGDGTWQAGEIEMRVRITEEIILPAQAYNLLLYYLSHKTYLGVLDELEKIVKFEQGSNQIIPLAVASNVLLTEVFALADREVDGSAAYGTLFLVTSALTTSMELAMSWYGRQFLDSSIGNVVRRMCAERVTIELDSVYVPAAGRMTGPGADHLEDLDANVRLLVKWCQEFWSDIWTAHDECPNELRKLFEHIRRLVQARYNTDPELLCRCVSAFCFSRFIVPAILHPHQFGLCQGPPPPPVQQSLTLVAKVIESLANLDAEEKMIRGVKDFVTHNLSAMIDYLAVVSNSVGDPHAAGPQAPEQRELADISNALRERLAVLPLLRRESVPALPYLLDVPKHLAVLASAVVRSCLRGPTSDEHHLRRLVKICFDVEACALQSVSQFARLSQRPALSILPPGARPASGFSHSGLFVGFAAGDGRQRSATTQHKHNPGPDSPLLLGRQSRDSSTTSPTHFSTRQGAIKDPDGLPSPAERRKSKSKRPSTAPATTRVRSPVAGRAKPLPRPRPTSAPTKGSVRAFGRSEADLRVLDRDKGLAFVRVDSARGDGEDENSPRASSGGSRDFTGKDPLMPMRDQGERPKSFFRGLRNKR